MNTVLLACKTIEAEIILALKNTRNQDINTIWVKSGLHDAPNRLQTVIQEELDRITNTNRVLLGFGTCGNAVLNLKAGDYSLILPRADDCITLLLGSSEARSKIMFHRILI